MGQGRGRASVAAFLCRRARVPRRGASAGENISFLILKGACKRLIFDGNVLSVLPMLPMLGITDSVIPSIVSCIGISSMQAIFGNTGLTSNTNWNIDDQLTGNTLS